MDHPPEIPTQAADLVARGGEALFRSLLRAAPSAILIVGADGRIVLVNRQVEELFGYKEAELLGQPVEKLMPARFAQVHAMHRDAYGRNPHMREMGAGLELYALHRSGGQFPVEISLSPLRVDDELLVTAVVRDITERKDAEVAQKRLYAMQLAEAEHLASLGEIAAGLAHEIKNPLAGIAGALEVLAPGFHSVADQSILDEVRHQVQRIKRTVEDLLNYARPRPLHLSVGDLNATVDEVVQFARRAAAASGAELHFVRGPLPPVFHDPDQIHRMVLNLVLNALSAAGQGGRVSVRTEFTTTPELQVHIHIEDNGPGIDAAILENIFRPFFTTKGAKGSGLGLPLCRRIAELHSGGITVTTEPGKGSRFTASLPITAKREAAQ